jgi:hypothetical protein
MNFGHWRSDFGEVAHYCSLEGKPGRKLVERLRPEDDDCTASPAPGQNEIALAYMKSALKVDATPSDRLDLKEMTLADLPKDPAPPRIDSA